MISLPGVPKTAILAAAIVFRMGARAAGSTCYWPDGSPATGLFVCSPNNAESACCANSDYCTTTGYCISSGAYYHYRSACTDKTWASSSCPQGCIGGTSTSNHSFVNILACDDRDGQWCCAYDGPCCNNTWQYPPLGQLLLNAVQVTSTASGSATAATAACTTTDYSTTTPTACASGDNSVAIGAGVGVPLGVIALVASAYAIWLHRKRRTSRFVDAKDQAQIALYGEPHGETEGVRATKEAPAYDPPPMHELGTQELHEAPGANGYR